MIIWIKEIIMKTQYSHIFCMATTVLIICACDDKGTDPEPENMPPVANFTNTSPYANVDITFDARNSFDPDGNITSVQWQFEDNTTYSSYVVVKRFLTLEVQTVRLTVIDNDGASDTERRDIEITLSGNGSDCEIWDGCYAYTSHRWPPGDNDILVHFSSNLIYLDPSWEGVSDNASYRAISEWHWNSGADIEFYYSLQPIYNGNVGRDQKNIICTGEIDGPGGTLGQMHSWYNTNTGYLVETDVIIDWDEPWGVNGESNKVDLQSVITHELGHVWTLADLYQPACRWETMAPGMANNTTKRTLYCGDKNGMQARYGIRTL
jgi:hypothetical protein